MSATDTMIARLRRMVLEPDASNGYDDDVLAAVIEQYPLLDADGNDSSSDDWTASYDLHAAARDVLEEKAAVVAGDFDFSADGGNYQRSQVYQQLMNLAHYHAARRRVGSGRMVAQPNEVQPSTWIGNLPEVD